VYLPKSIHAWLYRLSALYRVRPGVIVERGIRKMVTHARREGLGQWDDDMIVLTRWNGR